MKQALISPNEQVHSYSGALLGERVAEVSDTPFPVALPLFWMPCSDNVVADQFYYDPGTSQIIQIPPTPYVVARFSPSPVVLNKVTALTWTVTDASYVMLSSYGDQQFPISGSQDYTYTNIGLYDETITAIGESGGYPVKVSVRVVSTQNDLNPTETVPFTVI